jgi:hypothetical protein
MSSLTALTHADFQDYARPNRPKRELAGSKSLASMLPTLLTTGVITLVISAVMRLLWLGYSNDFYAAWMEAWLTTWPIAFPLAYLSRPFVRRLSNYLATPVDNTPSTKKISGLSLSQIEQVASNATAKNQLQTRRTAYIHRRF